MKVIFLGTSSGQPTKDRNVQSIYFEHKNEKILIDVGEGTQRQMRIQGLKPAKLTQILITHLHGDHIFGLGPLLRYLKVNNYKGILNIYGPKGLKDVYKAILKLSVDSNLDSFDIKIHEISDNESFETKHLIIESKKLNHSVPVLGYIIKEKDQTKINMDYVSKFGLKQHPLLGKLQEGEDIEYKGKKIKVKDATTKIKGKKMGLIADTYICENINLIAKDADLLICEATFQNEHEDKAKQYKHLTASMAGKIAKKENVKVLVLTHFSPRYKKISESKKEAKIYFDRVKIAKDFMEIKF